jgi:hypothetical protein
MRIVPVCLALSLFISITNCSDDGPENSCVPASKALTDISSLSNIADNGKIAGRPSCTVYSGARIYTCTYKGETTYYFVNAASSNSACVMIAYDCQGEELINWGSNQTAWSEFEAERSEEELLWQKN